MMSEPSAAPEGAERMDAKRLPPSLLLRSLVIWFVLYAGMLSLYNVSYEITSDVLIRRLQVVPSVWLLEKTLPDVTLYHTATTIRSPTLELQILRGCDGIEAWLMLVTALLVFPVPWRRRWVGVALGTVLIFLLNIMRIVTLFHIALSNPSWMEIAHGFVWQCLIILFAIAFVVIWVDFRLGPPKPAKESHE